MQWINEPPSYSMKLKLSDPAAGKLELIGPATSARVSGGVLAAFGTFFGSTALGFLRLPIPPAFKVLPLAFTVVGGGLGALGLALATGDISTVFERDKGVRFRWKIGPLPPRELFIPVKDIAAIDIARAEHESRDRFGDSTLHVSYTLHVVKKDGQSVPFEKFGLQSQARLRREQIEAVMAAAPKKTATRKKTGASRKASARKQ